jgi:hypothetical protein
MSLMERQRWAFSRLGARQLFLEADFIVCLPPKIDLLRRTT